MFNLFSKRAFSSITIRRHGESVWNKLRKVQGCSKDLSITLTAEGRLAIQSQLMTVPKPTVLITSDLLRAQQTAEAWFGVPFNQIPLPTKVMPAISEINAGIYEGKDIDSLKDDPLWQLWMTNPLAFPGFPGGENLTDFADRVKKGIASICAEYGDSKHHVCVISHGVVMRVLRCFLAGQSLEHIWSHQVANLEQIDLTQEQIKEFQAWHKAELANGTIQPNSHISHPSLSTRFPR